jgi:hypothetical protein
MKGAGEARSDSMTQTPRLFALGFLILMSVSLARAGEPIDASAGKPADGGKTTFYDVRALGVEGQGWSGNDLAQPFDRLPAKAKGVVRDAVWGLSHDSAGLCVRLVSDATSFKARWSLNKSNLSMAHMPATGVSGLDLYVRTDAGKWHWLAVGKPTAQTTTADLVSGLSPGKREYLVYFPLYNGVSSVEIGIPSDAKLYKPDPRAAEKSKPIVFYGTSITQGGCASRPGMCHPAILGRRLDRPTINLGFSGNGRMEAEVATLLAELDPAVYVIDCLPNMGGNPKSIDQRTRELVKIIRDKHPRTPILLVEDRSYADAFMIEKKHRSNVEGRAAYKKVFDELIAAGDKNLAYLPGESLLAADGEDTVDSSHPTDLGFVHQANAMQPALEELLHAQR